MTPFTTPPVFDPVFAVTYVAEGLEAALRELLHDDDLDDDEAEAVRVTIARISTPPVAPPAVG